MRVIEKRQGKGRPFETQGKRKAAARVGEFTERNLGWKNSGTS